MNLPDHYYATGTALDLYQKNLLRKLSGKQEIPLWQWLLANNMIKYSTLLSYQPKQKQEPIKPAYYDHSSRDYAFNIQ